VLHAFNTFGSYSRLDTLSGAEFVELLRFTVGGVAVLTVLAVLLRLIVKITEYHIYQSLDSFIVLSSSDEERRKKVKKKVFRKWALIGATWASSIMAGLVANYINHAGYFLPS